MEQYVYHIDSSKRDDLNESSTDFNISLVLPNNKSIRPFKVLLSRAVIPKTYLNVNENNTLILNEGSSDISITIPKGNYNFTRLASTLNTLFNQLGGFTYIINANKETGKMEFRSSSPATLTTNSEAGFENLLGLDINTTYNLSSVIFESPKIVNYHIGNNLRIKSNLVYDVLDSDIIANIPSSTVDQWEYIYYSYRDRIIDSKTLNPRANNKVRFKLTDENDRPIDLGDNHEWSCDIILYEDSEKILIDFVRKLDGFTDFVVEALDKYLSINDQTTTQDNQTTQDNKKK